jgi:hypothetical protein
MRDVARGKRAVSSGVWRVAAALLLAGCGALGPPPMEPLTSSALEAAERRWAAHGADAYHLVVRVRAPKFAAAVYDLVVARGRPVRVDRNGQSLRPEDADHYDYSVPGLFALLHDDLRLNDARPLEDAPPVDLRARFDPDTGRLLRYRRTVGTARRRVLWVEVLAYEPLAAAPGAASARRGSAIVL